MCVCARAGGKRFYNTSLSNRKDIKGTARTTPLMTLEVRLTFFSYPLDHLVGFPGPPAPHRRAGCSCTCPARAARALYCKLRDFAGLAEDKEDFEAETLSDLDLDLVILFFRLLRFVYSSARILRISKGSSAAEPVRGQDDGRRNCRVCEAEGETEGESERDPHEKKAGQP